MRNTTLKMMAVAIVILSAGHAASAQEFPGLGVGNIYAMNMQFDQQMDQANRNFCNQWYQNVQAWRQQTGDYTTFVSSGITAADLNRSNRELQNTYAGYNNSWYQNSERTMNAIGNYSQQAISGLGNYSGGGYTYQLPNTYNNYYLDNWGQAWGTNGYTPPNNWQNFTQLYGY